jgi:hypothetical protein
LYFAFFLALTGLLLLLLIWSLRKPRRSAVARRGMRLPEKCVSRHTAYLPQIQQALAEADYDYVSQRGSRKLFRRFRKGRRRIALAYLAGLREDFQNLLELARIIAVLSPEVAALQEFEKLRLTWQFRWRFEWLRLEIWLGHARLADVSNLSNVVGGLSVRMQKAIKELGERAALASKLGSSLDGGGVHPV